MLDRLAEMLQSFELQEMHPPDESPATTLTPSTATAQAEIRASAVKVHISRPLPSSHTFRVSSDEEAEIASLPSGVTITGLTPLNVRSSRPLANVLDKLPQPLQPRAKRALHEMMYAERRSDCKATRVSFEAEYQAKYPNCR
ncbi:MAG: hypothetical protein ABSD31_01985 [Candidatus Binataceae bacterium]